MRDNRALELPMSAQRVKIGANNACGDGYAFHVLQRDINARKRAHFQTGNLEGCICWVHVPVLSIGMHIIITTSMETLNIQSLLCKIPHK